MQAEEILREIVRLCKEYGAEKAILFGSRVKETAGERSDFDIAVSGVSSFAGLQEALEEMPTLYSIDLVDLDTCENTLLLEDIKKYGRKIYEKI